MANPILPTLTTPKLLTQHMQADLAIGGHGWGPRVYDSLMESSHNTDHEVWANTPWLTKIFDDLLPEGFHTHKNTILDILNEENA